MGTTMGTGNVHNDDEETLQFADEGEDVWEHDERACAEQNGDCACIPMPSVPVEHRDPTYGWHLDELA